MSDPGSPKIYLLPNLMTAGNLFCGFAATLKILEGALAQAGNEVLAAEKFHIAIWCILASCIFDALDGRLARMGGHESPFGREFDSLADIVSFGVAPAALGFALGLRGGWDSIALCFFVACGISRLARYNVTAAALSDESGKVKYYEGTPIPTSLALVLVLGIAFAQGAVGSSLWLGSAALGPFVLHPLTLMYVVSGALMVSTFRIPKP